MKGQAEMFTSGKQIIIYQPNETIRLYVWPDNETACLPQNQIREFFWFVRYKYVMQSKNFTMMFYFD